MARLSLSLASVTLLSSCLVADPPQYEPPQRTPPILDLGNAHPSNLELYVIDTTGSMPAVNVDFSIPVRSEDQGVDVWAFMFLDYTFPQERFITFGQAGASTIDDLSRTIQGIVSPASMALGDGCHSFTAVVAHLDSWDLINKKIKPNARSDAAFATWWLNVNPPPGTDPYTLPNCPSRSEVESGK